jgi:hypothetical protein
MWVADLLAQGLPFESLGQRAAVVRVTRRAAYARHRPFLKVVATLAFSAEFLKGSGFAFGAASNSEAFRA